MIAANEVKKTDIGSIPNEWDVVNLSDNSVADLIMGQSPSSSTYNQDGVGLPFMQGKAEFGRIYPNPDKWCSLPSRVAEQNDVLMSVRAPVGDVNIAPFKCAIGRGLAAIRAKQKSKSLYLFFYLCFAKKRLEDEGTGSTFKAINKGVLENFKIALPEIDEQKNIIAILSKLQQTIAQQEQIIAKTKELKRSLMHRLFTYGLWGEELKETEIGLMPVSWNYITLGDVCNYTTGKLNSNAARDGGQYPFFTCSQETFKIDRYSFDQEALLLAGNNARAIYSVKYYNGKFDVYQRTYVISIKDTNICSYKYLLYELTRKLEMLRVSSLGSTTKYLTAGIIKGLKIVFPPLDEQEEIAAILGTIDGKLITESNRKNYLNHLFKTMLNNLMTGQVRVKDVDFYDVVARSETTKQSQ